MIESNQLPPDSKAWNQDLPGWMSLQDALKPTIIPQLSGADIPPPAEVDNSGITILGICFFPFLLC